MQAPTPRMLNSAALALAALAVIGTALTAPPASAHSVDDFRTGSARGSLACPLQVVAVNGDRKLVLRSVTNGRVTSQRTGTTPLSYQPTALGFYKSSSTSTSLTLQVSAVTTDGVPRVLKATYPKTGTSLSQTSRTMKQTGFRPRLFADSAGYQAYTVNTAGVLNRWYFTRDADGAFFFSHRQQVGTGYGGLRTLQIGNRLEVGGIVKDFLYATTATGALKQIAVPIDRPARERVVTLKASGYKGVTGLSTSYCNSDATFSTIVAVNATAGSATWTTVRGAGHATAANTVKRGAVGPGSNWVLHAVM